MVEIKSDHSSISIFLYTCLYNSIRGESLILFHKEENSTPLDTMRPELSSKWRSSRTSMGHFLIIEKLSVPSVHFHFKTTPCYQSKPKDKLHRPSGYVYPLISFGYLHFFYFQSQQTFRKFENGAICVNKPYECRDILLLFFLSQTKGEASFLCTVQRNLTKTGYRSIYTVNIISQTNKTAL